MVDINKIIDELLLELSVTYPIPNMKDKEQIIALMEICDDLGYGYIKPTLYEMLCEAEGNKESGLFPGKFHLGGGYYSSKDGGEAEFKNEKGKLRPVTPEEKAKFDSKGMPAKKEIPTSQEPKDTETKPKEQPSPEDGTDPSAFPNVKLPISKDKIKQKIEKWSEKEKEFFNKGQENPGSETRRSFAQALKDKAKGARNAIVHGLKHEAHIFKTAAKAVGKVFSEPGGFRSLEKEEKKALISVGIKVATTALTAGAFGGLAHGGIAFAKHVAMELVPHVVAETIIVGAGKASLFADKDGNDERALMDFMDSVADQMENMEIPDEVMNAIVDSYNEKNKVEQPTQSEVIDLNELLNKLITEEEGEGESKEFPGKFHLGGGYYASTQDGEAEFKNDKGTLRPLTDEEKEQLKSKESASDKESEFINTATKELEKKENELEKTLPKENPDLVLNDPNASAKSVAMARAFKGRQNVQKEKQKEDPSYQKKAKEELKSKVETANETLKSRKSTEDEILDSETTENGSLLIGVEHGEGTESTQDVIKVIKSLPKDAKVMFVGEGGVGLDDNDKIDFVGEQAEIRDAFLDHFENGIEESWDENGDVRNSDSPIFDEIAKSFGGDKEKSLASVWTNMIGQGDDLDADDYLTDATKEWIKSEAKKGGSEEFNGDVDWNNLSLEQKEDLYQLNFRDDQNYGETDLFKGQKAFNDYRQKELDRKIKEGEERGFTVIATMGNSHVDLWRKRNKPKKTDFNPKSLRTLSKELPDADSEVFTKQSDLGKIPDDTKKEISMKIDELAAKADKGEDFNLCQITVPGTNLYCDDNQGIPREEMPQFKGKPLPGTPAADMPTDNKGEVDTEPLFKKMLKEKGIKTVETEVPSDKLKATQSELVGSKVAGMTKALEEDPNNPGITAPIYVSRDGFVIDGHHRWAAVTSAAIKAGKPANMKVIVVDMDIKDAIPMCNQFAEEQGIAAKKADARDGELPKPKPANETPNSRVYNVGGNYYSDTPDGPAQYVKTESVIQKIFVDEDVKFFNLIFETVVTKKDGDGNPIKLTVIPTDKQTDATKKADTMDDKKDGKSEESEIPSYQIDYYNDVAKETAVKIEENTPAKDRIAAMQILYGKLQLISMGQNVELDDNDIANLSKLVISANPRSGQLYDSSFGLEKDKGIESARKKSPNYANRNIDKNQLLNKWDKVNQYLDSKGVPSDARPKFKAGVNSLIDTPPKIGHNPVSMKPNRIMESAPQTSAKELISQKTIDDLYNKQGIKVGDDKMFGYPLDRNQPSTFLKNIELVINETQKYIDESNSPDTKQYFDKFNKGISDILSDNNLSEDEKLQKINQQLPDLFTQLYNDSLEVSDDEAKNVLKDFGELIVYMDFLSRKEEVYLPVSGNYPLGDVIVVKRDGNGDALTIDSVSIKSQRGSEEQPGSSAFEFTKHFSNVYPEHKDIFDTIGALHTNSIDSVKMDDIKDEKIKKEIELIKKLEKIKSFDEAKKVCKALGIEWEKVELQLKYQYEKYKNELEYNPQSMSNVLKELVFRRYSAKKTLDTLCDLNLDTKLKFVEVVVEPKKVAVRPKGENSKTCDFAGHDKGYLGKGKILKTPPPPHVEQVKYQSANLALRYKPKKNK